MKKNDVLDLSQPTRQSYVAILQIVFKTLKIIFRQIWPFAILIFVGKNQKFGYFLYFAIAIAVLSMVYSLINYFRFYFYTSNDELVIESGVFGKKKIAIPFDRVQTINVEQNIVHQIFNVVKLNIDTAGTSQKEFQLDAVTNEIAEALRSKIIGTRSSRKNDQLTEENQTKDKPLVESPILKLGLKDLLLAGLVENHLKSGGLIFLLLYWIFNNLEGIVELDDYKEQLSALSLGLFIVLTLFLLFGIVSIIISLGRTIVRYYNLTFYRIENGFKVKSGLFTEKTVSAQDHKIQTLCWNNNLLKKAVGLHDLRLEQAGVKAINVDEAINIPACSMQQIQFVMSSLYPKFDLSTLPLVGVDKRMFYRKSTIYSIFFFILFATAYYWYGHMAMFALLIFPFIILQQYLNYSKTKFGTTNNILFIKGGSYGDKNTILPIFKIQAIKIKQSPYQRKRGLANLVLFHAAGKETIPYVSHKTITELSNFFLKQVETSAIKWM